MRKVAILTLLAGCVILAGATHAVAQDKSPSLAQIVALDECDPVTFNAAVGPDFAERHARSIYYTVRAIRIGGGWNSRSGLGLRTRQVDDQAGDHRSRGRPRR